MSNRLRASLVLLATLMIAGILRADAAKDAGGDKPVATAGILTDTKPDFAMIWTDGEDGPVKYTCDASCDRSMVGKFVPTGIFPPDRVQITYVNTDGGRKLMSIRREKTVAKGTITGTVLFCDGKFWVAVKPANGPADGFALNWPLVADIVAKLKALKNGDIVVIRFHTDLERHRIDSLEVKPPAATQPQAADALVGASATTVPSEGATTQPAQTPEALAQAKLKLAQLYIDNGYNDRARTALLEIVKLYPDTEAAKDAQTKLKGLGN